MALTNQDYFERWENAAPTPVAGTLTPEEIEKHQGSRFKNKAPWETYNQDLGLSSLDSAIDEYGKRVHDSTSNQNKEELARWQEHNEGIAKEYQWVEPAEYADAGARVGRRMHSSEFIRILRKAGVKCWYRNHPQERKVTLVVLRKGQKQSEVGCWVQLGFAPELSIMDFDEHGIPLAEKYRGWRTCLLQLILKSVISQKDADRVFGRPKTTEAFHRYNSTLQSFRNNGNRLG